jgi:SAM-dependent methyltransferase
VSFDAVAPWYRALETIAFGNALQRARVVCLPEITAPRRALILGEGNGRFVVELLRMHPGVEPDVVDASERMIDLARARVGRELPNSASRVRFRHANAMNWEPGSTYDLIVTHFFFDCFRADQITALTEKLAGAASDDAVWLLADFTVPASPIGRLRARVSLAAMYSFFRIVSGIDAKNLVDPSPFVAAQQFALESNHLSLNGTLKSQRWRRRR